MPSHPDAVTRRGRLIVVGSGIQFARHINDRTVSELRQADVVFSLADAFAMQWLLQLRPDAIQLGRHYGDDRDRRDSYIAMEQEILAPIRAGKRVCALFYGHPGVFAQVPHSAIAAARAEGFEARMEPGISAEACLYADLGLDPGATGVQSIEATQFLIQQRQLDPACLVLLWQVALAGNVDCVGFEPNPARLQLLVDKLYRWYPPDHEVILYEAAQLPIEDCRAERLPLCGLPQAQYREITTLVIPRVQRAEPDIPIQERLREIPR